MNAIASLHYNSQKQGGLVLLFFFFWSPLGSLNDIFIFMYMKQYEFIWKYSLLFW